MKKILLTVILLSLGFATSLQSQQKRYFTGSLLNDSAYVQIPQKPVLLTRSYDVLPQSHSLRQYCPSTKDQGPYGTCASWATAYAARTISEAIANNWIESLQITRETFSPLFIYSLAKKGNDSRCQTGVYLGAAFEILKMRGVAKYRDFNFDCSSSASIPGELHVKARSYTIDNYFALFSGTDPYSKKISTTKKSIAENRPVVISMEIFNSFQKDNEKVWSGIRDVSGGYHAMCVVAYDDNKYGGSFLLMNSWGPKWGIDGFKWIRYTDFNQYVNYAMEMYVRKKNVSESSQPKPTPKPEPVPPIPIQSELVDLAGELYFVLSTGQKIRPNLRIVNNTSYYVLEGSYISGTRYRLYLSNNEPAYVYVIGSDLKNSVTKVFPPNDRISAALVYKSNDIAIPDEKWYIEMDNTKGKDYICVLYSKDELPINNIVRKIKAESGSFFEKVNKALIYDIIPARAIKYDASTIKFSVGNTNKIVVPIIVEIDHQ